MSSAASRQICYCLIALMMLIVRTADAHAHLCADGKEPPATIHLGDGGTHPCDGDQSSEHSGDENVQISADVVLKTAPSLADPGLPALLAFACELVAPRSEKRIPFEPATLRVESSVYLRPPPRGPPH